MFIVIDWIDWSWKWTQVELVRKELEFLWKKVKVFRLSSLLIWISFYGKKVFKLRILKNISPKLASIFYAIDRYDLFFLMKKIVILKNMII